VTPAGVLGFLPAPLIAAPAAKPAAAGMTHAGSAASAAII
jgi:hypothetical protein